VDPSFLFSLFFFTSFIRILFVFSILRRGLGFCDLPSALAVVLVSAALSFSDLPSGSDVQLSSFSNSSTIKQESREADDKIAQMLVNKTDPVVLEQLLKISRNRAGGDTSASTVVDKPKLSLLIGAFALSELRKSFQMGVTFLVPFVVIDIFLAVLISLVGISSLSVEMVSFPAKILAFLALDGWSLVLRTISG
jgi:flagellar biosynthetic protein FliP